MQPLVSIIIPMYNAEIYISETLDSLLHQVYRNWECIVVDDGSTDNSNKIVLGFCEKDKRFRYYKQKNAGPSCARNQGFNISKGDFIQFLDADDVILPQRLKILLDEYYVIKDKVILYSDLLVGDNDDINKTIKLNSKATLGEDIDFHSMYKHFPNNIHFIPGCVLFPREAIINIKWDESLSYSEDWDYYLQITKSNKFLFRNIPIVLFVYRNTKGSLSTNLEGIYRANYQIIERYRTRRNTFVYCKKCGLILYSNILNYRKKRISRIVLPFHFKSYKVIYSLIFFPITLFFFSLFLFLLFIKAIRK